MTTQRAPHAPARRPLLSFPDTVDERAARTVAAGVVAMVVVALAVPAPVVLVPLAYGFWARLASGPTLSPLGQLATRVVVPRLPGPPRPTPGPPKRFAQAMGAAMSTLALVVWLTAGWAWARWVLVLLAVPATLEAAFGYCVGCRIFAALMRRGVIPTAVCEACADVSLRRPEPTAR